MSGLQPQWRRHRLTGRFVLALITYCALVWPLTSIFGWNLGNDLNPLFFFALALLTFAAAFSHAGLSDSVLHRNDISYGVYLYHMPVVNLLLALGLGGAASSLSVALGATVSLPLFAWFVIDKPALRLKRHALYNHSVGHSAIRATRKPS